MKLKKAIFIFVILICYNTVYAAITANKIIAYPVPFNPNKNTLTIGTQGTPLTGYSAKISIYDINGDLVIQKSATNASNTKWNGRNKSGRVVKPGLYILKVEIENISDPSEYIKKIIRILIDY